jgi:hypothetical protein
MFMSNKFIKMTKPSHELSDTISLRWVRGYTYRVSGDITSLLETYLLMSYEI